MRNGESGCRQEHIEAFAAAAGRAVISAINPELRNLAFIVIVGDNTNGNFALATELDRATAALLIKEVDVELSSSDDPGMVG